MIKMHDNKKVVYNLPSKWLAFIIVYLIILFAAGIFFTIFIIINLQYLSTKNVMTYTLINSLALCLLFCSMKYIRKLYKAGIENRIDTRSTSIIKSLGNILYFVFRPLFSCAFTIMGLLTMLSGILVITVSINYIVNERFLYVASIMSGCIGYSIGTVLDKYQILSERIINNNFNNKENIK